MYVCTYKNTPLSRIKKNCEKKKKNRLSFIFARFPFIKLIKQRREEKNSIT